MSDDKVKMVYDHRRAKMVPEGTVREKTNPLPVIATHEAEWDLPLKQEVPARIQARIDYLGKMEEIGNKIIHRNKQVAQRRAKRKQARKSRRANR